MSDQGVFAAFNDFLKAVEQECISLCVLSGTYAVHLDEAIQEFPKKRAKLRAEIIDFVRNTQSASVLLDQKLFIDGVRVCRISKVGDKTAYIGLTQSWGGWEAEIAPAVCQVLRSEVDDKCQKLNNVLKPHILILVDQFPLASPYVWFDCLVSYLPAQSFHTVFVVTEKQDYAVLTGEQGWPVLDRDSQYAKFGFPE